MDSMQPQAFEEERKPLLLLVLGGLITLASIASTIGTLLALQ